MLLKGKNDDQLKWPMNLPYKLEIRIEDPHGTTVKGRQTLTTVTPRHTIRTVQLSDNLERVSSVCSKEVADIDLLERELLEYVMVVRLVPVNLLPQVTTAVPHAQVCCFNCFKIISVMDKHCYNCGHIQY
jgi:hypothetical protein